MPTPLIDAALRRRPPRRAGAHAAAWAGVLMLAGGCAPAAEQGQGAGGTFTITGRYTPYQPSSSLDACTDGRSADVFKESEAGGTAPLLASSPLRAKTYDTSTQSCVYEWAVTLPIQSERYGICLEYPNARGVIPPGLWMTRAQIDDVVGQSGGVFVLSL
jgi:hypothetical protein